MVAFHGMDVTCSIDAVLKILFAGAFLGALPGAALANIGAAFLKKKLGLSQADVRTVDDTGGQTSGQGGDADDADGDDAAQDGDA